jgi:hypothetical protein
MLTTTVTPAPQPEFHVGDVIPLRTSVILDHNKNVVPDGTPVSFAFTYGSETSSTRQVAYTQKGIARTTYAVPGSGTLEIRAESESARSEPIKWDIPSPTGESPTNTPPPEPTFTPTQIPPTSTLAATPPVAPAPIEENRPDLLDWLFAVLISCGMAFAVYRLAINAGEFQWGVRAALMSIIGGLLAYTYLVLGLPGSKALLNDSIPGSFLLLSAGGAFTGLISALVWRTIARRKRSPGAESDQPSP